MPTIRQLSTSIINKIAAGEVIERPASVVKEMLENSVDAGATRIELSVEKGGVDLIRISDNGCGIDADQLELAIAPHATSKITSADELFEVQSLGFRGEALASIAEISHLVLRSRPRDAESGAELIVRGGEREGPRPCAASVGTTIEVRHLFFNTPVRRKFMKSPQTEMGHVTEAFTRIALAFPQVHLVLESSGRTVYDLAPCERWSERIRVFFGDEVGDALIPIDNVDGDIHLRGYVTDPSVTRSNNRMQYLFLNGRHIRDRSLQHALTEAYRGLIMVGRFPVCFLRLDMPPTDVDVNVHPTKSEVRFADGGRLYSQILHSLRHKFLSTDLTANAVTPSNSSASSSGLPFAGSSGMSHLPSPHFGRAEALAGAMSDRMQPGNPAMTFDARSPSISTAHTDSLLRWARGNESTPEFQPFPSIGPNFRDVGGGGALPSSSGSWESRIDDRSSSVSPSGSMSSGLSGLAEPLGSSDRTALSPVDATFVDRTSSARSHLGFQIHHRYLVTEDERGMVVVDQHALHERILYEQVREKVLSGSLESQKLLVPEPVTLNAAEAAAAIDAQEMLAKVGIEVEPFGGDTVLITAYPAMLSNISPSEMLRQVLEPLMESGKQPEPRDLLDSLLHMIACKAAIKAGDRLTPEEITSLLEQRHCYADTHHCPHGRPTALFFSREQLDKMFKRT